MISIGKHLPRQEFRQCHGCGQAIECYTPCAMLSMGITDPLDGRLFMHCYRCKKFAPWSMQEICDGPEYGIGLRVLNEPRNYK